MAANVLKELAAGTASRLRTPLDTEQSSPTQTQHPNALPPRGAVPVNQGRGLEFFNQHAGSLSDGCDVSSYVGKGFLAEDDMGKVEFDLSQDIAEIYTYDKIGQLKSASCWFDF